MAELTYFYDAEDADGARDVQVHSNTMDSGANPAQVLGSVLSANTKYLILGRAMIGGSSNTLLIKHAIGTDDDRTIEFRSDITTEFQETALAEKMSYLFAHSFITSDDPADVEFMGWGTSNGNARFEKSSLFVLDLDAISAPNLLGTHYFDASDAGPTDSGADWTNDANAFDGSISTSADTNTSGGGALTGEGTTAPTSGSTIGAVEVRILCVTPASGVLDITIDEDSVGGTELLALQVSSNRLTPTWKFGLITPPGGGWTWQKVNDLAISFDPAATSGYEVFKAEIRVYDENGQGYFEDAQAPNTSEEHSLDPATTVLTQISGSDMGTDEHLILGYAKSLIGSAGRWYNHQLYASHDGSSSTFQQGHQAEGEDTAERRLTGFSFRHKASSGTPNVTIYGQQEAGNANMFDVGAYLIALPTVLFADFEWDYTVGSIVADGETTIASVGPYTPSVNGNHLILGQARASGAGLDLFQVWAEDGTTEIRSGDSTPTHNQIWDDGKDFELGTTLDRYSISSEVTINLRGDRNAASPQGLGPRSLIVINLNKAAAQQTIAVGTLAETDSLIPAVPLQPIVTAVGVLAEINTLIGQPPVVPNLTDLTSGTSPTDATSVATASIAPSANSVVIATVATRKAATPQNAPTLTGAGMTWVQIRDFFYDDAGEVGRLTMFRALDASPGSGVLTFDYAGQTQKSFVWTVVEFDNVDISGTNGSGAIVQDAQNPASVGSGTVIDVTLAAFGSPNNVAYGVAVKESNQDADMVGDSAMTDINEEADGENDQRLLDQWKQSEENTVSWSWGTARRRVGFAVEIKAGVGETFPQKGAVIGTLAETDGLIVVPVTVGGQTLPVSVLAEADALLPVAPEKFVPIGTLAETDLLRLISTGIAPIGTLAQSESLLAIQALKIADIGTLAETDALLTILSGQEIPVGTLREENFYRLDLDGVSGSNVETPHHASLGITGDIDLRFEARLDNWADGTLQVFVSKYRASSGNRSYRFYSSSGGSLTLQWSEDGDAVRQESVTIPASWLNGSRRHARATMDVDNGASDAEIKFFESPDGIVWTQVGATQFEGVTTSIHVATGSDLKVGTNSSNSEAAAGKFYSAQVYDGIDGTLVANFDADDFDLKDSDADTAVDSTGKTWTIGGNTSSIIGGGPQPIAGGAADQTIAVGVIAAIDALLPVSPEKIASIGTLAEVESLLAIGALKVVNIGTLAELESLLAIAAVKPIIQTVGTQAELEALIGIGGLKTVDVGTLTEADALVAIAFGRGYTVGTLIETDDLVAIAFGRGYTVGTLAEADTLLPVAPEKFAPIGTLAELESLIAVGGIKTADIGTLAEIETLIAIGGIKTADIGTLAEIESLIAVAADLAQVVAVTTLAETDDLVVIQPIKVVPIGTIAETDVLIAIAPVKPIITSVGTLAEADVLNAIQAIRVAPIGTLAEVESLLSVVGLKTADIGTIAEIESLIAVQALKVAVIGVIAETDTLIPIDPVKPIFTAVGILIETDALISVQAVHVANIGTLAELEALLPVGGLKTISVGTLPETDALIPVASTQTQVVSVTTLAELETLIAITGLKTADIGTLAEIETLIAVQALKVVIVGTLAETDVLIPVAPVKPIITTVGTLAELESLIAVTGLKIADIGTLAEIESLLAVQALKVVVVGTLAETDALIPVSATQTQVVPVATLAELDVLIALAGLKTVDVGTLAEIESLLAIGALKVANIGTIAEAESLIGIAAIKPIITAVGVIAEIESLLPISALKVALIGIIAELESLIGISGIKTADIGTIAESDILIPVTAGVAQTIAVSTLAELDALIAVGGIKVANIGTLAEIETLLAVSPFKTVDVGTLAETEALIAVAGLKLATIGTLAEVETLLAIQGLKIADIGTLAELEALLAIASGRAFGVGTLPETDTPLPVQPLKVAQIGTLAEVEALLPILAVKPILTAVGTMAELDALIAANPLKGVQIGTLAEADSLISIDALKIAPIGTMVEVNNLLSIAGFKTVDVGTMAELETLLSIQAVKGVPVGTVLETNGLIPIQALKPILQNVGTLGETDILVGIVGFLGEPVIFVMNVESVGKRTSVTATEYDATQDATVEGT